MKRLSRLPWLPVLIKQHHTTWKKVTARSSLMTVRTRSDRCLLTTLYLQAGMFSRRKRWLYTNTLGVWRLSWHEETMRIYGECHQPMPHLFIFPPGFNLSRQPRSALNRRRTDYIFLPYYLPNAWETTSHWCIVYAVTQHTLWRILFRGGND